ncbi:coilin-like [Mytilus trossulus]|uniref:coilin-like n=1 Tax=Mytilus trossulus TaxID=6551 RepID=UPI0030074783
MAAPMVTHVRIKVYFENNEFDASWLLIDTDDLRTMKDVQRHISLKFLGKAVPLYLSLQGCLLPDWEKSVILRDNDCVNAKCIHQDSFENQTILLLNEQDGDIIVKSDKKKKHKHDKEKSEDKLTSNYAENKDTYSNEKDMQIATSSSVPMETSPPKQKHKKKKHKHKHETVDNMQTEQQTEKKRKRKHCPEEKIEDVSFDEPVGKKKAVNSCELELSLKPSMSQKNNSIERFPDSDSAPTNMTKLSSISVAGENKIENTILLGEHGKGSEKKEKRKRVRKRKRKSVTETPPQTQNLDTNVVKNAWNWNTGKTFNSEPINSKANGKHKKFTSDSNDSSEEDALTNKSEKHNSSINYSYDYGNTTENKDLTQTDTTVTYNNSYSRQSKSDNQIICDRKTDWNKSVNRSGYAEETVQSPNKRSEKIADQPSVLSTSYLSNGVAVYSRNRRKQQQNSKQYPELTKEDQLNTKLTNVSVILQNTSFDNKQQGNEYPEKETSAIYEAVPVDYSKFPDLIGPPRPGDRLAYKVIELSETYTPEVSDYKEAIVVSYIPATKTVELENQQEGKSKLNMNGKFEVVFEDEENIATETDLKVFLPLESLIEPKLLS